MINLLETIERRPTASLVPYAQNSRVHPEAQLAQLEASFRQWGFTTPVLIDEADGIIAGHGRVVVAHRLGMPEVSVIVARGWSEEQKRAYVIADNKIPEGAEWNLEILGSELLALQAADFTIADTGFDAAALLKMLEPSTAAPRVRARRRSRGGPEVDLVGNKLDEAIADIEEGLGIEVIRETFYPSSKWDQAGPILRREQIDLRCKPGTDGAPDVWTGNAPGYLKESDTEPLIAGMRAVLAKYRGGAAAS